MAMEGNLALGDEHTFNIQIVYYRIVYLESIYDFISQDHPNKFH